MGCWSVELVVFFLLLTIKSYRLRISSSPNHSSPYHLYMYGFKIAK